MKEVTKKELLSLTYLRGMAALLIVIFHMRGYINNIYENPKLGNTLFGKFNFGVDLFFMISGFIIVYATQAKESNGARYFLIRRLFRVYPLFLFCILIGILTIYQDAELLQKIRALLLIHVDYSLPPPGYGYNLMGPAWTLTYEIYFYLIFCIAIIISHKHRILITSLLLLAQVVMTQIIVNHHVSISANTVLNFSKSTDLNSFLQFISSSMFLEFILGMLLAKFFLSSVELSKKHSLQISLLTTAVFFILMVFMEDASFGPQSYGISSFALITGVIIFEKNNVLSRNKTLIFLGDISYALYISHYIVISSVHKYDFFMVGHTAGFYRLLYVLALCIIFAISLHYVVEKPFIRLGKYIINFLKKNHLKKAVQI